VKKVQEEKKIQTDIH